jgi:hypothetical protein
LRAFVCGQTKEFKSSCHAGPGPIASRTCIDKVASSLAVDHVCTFCDFYSYTGSYGYLNIDFLA